MFYYVHLLSGPKGKSAPVGCVAYDKRHGSSTAKSPSRLRCVRHRFRRRAPCHRDSLLWVKRQNTRGEQMFSGTPKPDIAQCSRHVRNVPETEVNWHSYRRLQCAVRPITRVYIGMPRERTNYHVEAATIQSFDCSRSATRRAISADASSGIGKTELTLISPST
jgi:hypothetical protein